MLAKHTFWKIFARVVQAQVDQVVVEVPAAWGGLRASESR